MRPQKGDVSSQDWDLSVYDQEKKDKVIQEPDTTGRNTTTQSMELSYPIKTEYDKNAEDHSPC